MKKEVRKTDVTDVLMDFKKIISDSKRLNVRMPILIDNMNKEKINEYLKIIPNILKKYKVVNNVYTFDKETIMDKVEENSLVIIDNFDKFNNKIIDYSEYRMDIFFKLVKEKNITLLITCEKNIEEYYNKYFNEKILNPNLCIRISDKDISKEEILKDLIKKYKENDIKFNLNNNEIYDVINYLLDKKICGSNSCSTYLYDYSLKKKVINQYKQIEIDLFEDLIEKEEKKESNINNLIGLENVKEELNTLKNYLNFKNKTKKKLDKMYLNMFFLGNPGTGKTTVARQIATDLYNLGYIKENKVVEIIPNDLMANYVGQTKDQTRKYLNKAKGGILFIDEAYNLSNVTYSDGYASYMKEAISELLKYLENPENVVIFAGYKDEMLKVYNSNPGIKSRIFKEIEFPDYSVDELFLILENLLKEIDLKISNNAKDKIKQYIENEKNKPNFGNARFIEQFAQILITNHANRKLKSENFIITDKDIPNIKIEKTKLGFIGG